MGESQRRSALFVAGYLPGPSSGYQDLPNGYRGPSEGRSSVKTGKRRRRRRWTAHMRW